MTTSNQEASIEELVLGTPAGESKSWNWHPDIPIKTNPLFEFPLDLAAILRWYAADGTEIGFPHAGPGTP